MCAIDLQINGQIISRAKETRKAALAGSVQAGRRPVTVSRLPRHSIGAGRASDPAGVIVLSQVGVPIVKDYPVCDFKTEVRPNMLF